MKSWEGCMGKPLVKICGITNVEDARICLFYGTDMLGFIFYNKSPRFVSPDMVREIITTLKNEGNSFFKTVGVFVNPEKEFVNHAIEIAGVDLLQFHGKEPQSFIHEFNKKSIKAFRIKEKIDVEGYLEYRGVDYFLFDTFFKESYGGTGKIFDWCLIKDFKEKDKLFLAGGLNSDNIIDAITTVKPFAVDLSSGLESLPGKKDKKKIEKFFLTLNSY